MKLWVPVISFNCEGGNEFTFLSHEYTVINRDYNFYPESILVFIIHTKTDGSYKLKHTNTHVGS